MAEGSLALAGGPPVVLASASPARAALLRAVGLEVAIEPAHVDEAALRASLAAEGVAAADAATALAELKAQRVAARHQGDVIVIGADQILALGGRWLDKPADLAQAREQLRLLRGRRHELASAAVVFRSGGRIWHQTAGARLWMRPFGDAFLEAYLARCGERLLASVGAYQIEAEGAQLFSRIEGDWHAVLGLPLLPLLECLRVQGVLPA